MFFHNKSCFWYDLITYFEFIADAPDGADLPVGMILDLLTETFDVYIHGTGITDIFIAPDLIQELFSGEYMVR